MQILFVHNFHQKHGGDDTVVENYMAMLERRGHAVELYQRHNDEIHTFGFIDKVKFFIDAVFSTRTRRELSRLIKAFQPDLLFVHGIYPLISPSAYHAAFKLGIPIVQMVHDMRMWCPSAWFFRDNQICTLCENGNFRHAVRYRCYRNSRLLSAIYGLSIYLARKRGFFQRISLFMIPGSHISTYLTASGVSEDRIAYCPHIVAELNCISPQGKSHEPFVGFLGRLSPEKGLRMIMEAAKRYPQIPFQIAGTGPMEAALRNEIRNLPNVRLVGFLDREQKAQFLQNAALLAVPSECYESFGQVVVEAYMAGTPVLAAGHGSLSSLIVEGETGWLFHPGDVDDFCRLLMEVWMQPEKIREVGNAARAFQRENLSEEVLGSLFERCLESVVQK